MDEVFPVLAGVVLGLVTHLLRPIWLRTLVVGSFGLAFGAVASWTSGELAISEIYLLIDAAQVIAASIMTAVLIRIWRRRSAQRIAG
jgi:hypothetical protein